ncbi:asparagine synthase (glutamine-hydrolyzing) [Alphaproteobacteria bacterium]|nr:asparagine synthase (glutamine-hydrolyzing) [Alphaproteobacteria bacterium]
MCGITGFWDFENKTSNPERKSIICNMTQEILSRGPDGDGFWLDAESGFTLGHRRLSVIDLSNQSSQPMISRCERFILSYNGEVYNFPEIKADLELKGIVFKTHSDTEVVLEACIFYGVFSASRKFIGMFSFSLWDRREKKVHLVRDRLGIKPLYWGIHNDVLFFGSQLKSFRPHPAWNPKISSKALSLYFQYKYIPTPFSIYKDIFKLEAGHVLTIDQKKHCEKKSFWSLEDSVAKGSHQRSLQRSPQEVLEELEHLLDDAVGKRLISDVPIGCFLSGGIDSSLVAATMQSLNQKPIQTFSIGFEKSEYNEAPQAKRVAHFLGTDHHQEILTEEKCLEIIPNLASFYDEPFSDSSQIPTYLVSALAKSKVTVALSGDGGDELFGGYNRYKAANKYWGKLSMLPQGLRSAGAHALSSIPTNLLDSLGSCFHHANTSNKVQKIARILNTSSEQGFYNSLVTQNANFEHLLKMTHENLPLKNLEGLSFVEKMQYWDMKTYLMDDILTKVDRASMAIGLEARVPLLDHRLVEYSWTLPQNLKIHKGETKWVLKRALAKKVPPNLFSGPKKGFSVPLSQWLRGPLKSWASDLILSAELDGIQESYMRRLWSEHQSYKQDHHELLWSYLMYKQWYRTYH